MEDLLRDLDGLDGDEKLPGSEEVSSVSLVQELFSGSLRTEDIESVAKLQSSEIYTSIIEKIEKNLEGGNRIRPLDEEEEHKLIVQANNLAAEIENEIVVIHKFIRELYSRRFPELDTLITNPLDYARAVKVIGNKMEIEEASLKEFLPPATVMVVTVTSTTTEGRSLSEDVIEKVNKSCDATFELETSKRKILAYVESKMNYIAPNLSILLGSCIAAKLIGIAGGLAALAAIPACNTLILGKSKKGTMGLSLMGYQNHRGIVYLTEIVAAVPQEYKRKAARALSAKVCLAARVDLCKFSPNGAEGRKYREHVQKYIDLLLQPSVIKAVKPLPIPDEGPKRRRAGRRVRGLRQSLQLNELHKASNRMIFGVPEKEVGFELGETEGLGLAGDQINRIRSIQADNTFKLPMSKRHKLMTSSTTNASGFSSSVAFTPVKGIELENPDLQVKRKPAKNEDRYFSSTTFAKIVPKMGS